MSTLNTFVLWVWCCLALTKLGESSKDVLQGMSTTFKKALDDCKREGNLPESVQKDFDLFWHDDYEVTNKDTGCAIKCLAHKLEIIDPDLYLIHGNTKEWALNHGADEELAEELLGIIHQCGNSIDEKDGCLRLLKWAKCFKAEIHKRDLNPPVEAAFLELIAEV